LASPARAGVRGRRAPYVTRAQIGTSRAVGAAIAARGSPAILPAPCRARCCDRLPPRCTVGVVA